MISVLCIVLLAFLGLGIILNLMAKIVLTARKGIVTKTPFLENNHRLEQLKQVMPEQNEEDIKEIICCFSSSQTASGRFRMIYAPFTEHKDIPFSSRFLNISPEGFRLNSQNGDSNPRDTSRVHIFLFGGSTTLGYGVKDADTIASYLEKRLNKGGDYYRVFNCGRQSYFSTMEAIAFQQFLQEGVYINIAVFIDGLNDVFHNCPVFRNRSRYSEHIDKFWNYIDYLYGYADETNPWLDSSRFLKRLINQMPLVQLVRKCKKRVIDEFMGKYAQEMRLHEPWALEHNPDAVETERLAQQISQLTLTNWDIIRGISRQFDIGSIFCLQPVYYTEDMPLENHLFLMKNEHPLWKRIYKQYYQNIRDKASSKDDFIDLSTVFQGAVHCPYVDSHHYSPYGNRLIAETIAEYIIGNKWIKELERKKIFKVESARLS